MEWRSLPLRQIHIELSSHCNAACPICPRYWQSTRLVRPDLQLASISIDDFVKWFPADSIAALAHFHVCGTMGDPLMAKDCLEIFDYVMQAAPQTGIHVHTNGGMRNSEFWSKFGSRFTRSNTVSVFSIDGLEDTNHLYRRNVDWATLMCNAEAYIAAGGTAYWEYLVFQHNEHQIDEARALAMSMGFKEFKLKRAFGFDEPHNGIAKPKAAYDREGEVEYLIYPPSQTEFVNTDVVKLNFVKDYRAQKIELDSYHALKEDPSLNPTWVDWDSSELNAMSWDYLNELNTRTIECKSHKAIPGYGSQYSEIYVNSRGIVFPCCFIGTRYDSGVNHYVDRQIKHEINNNIDRLDLNQKTIGEILKSGVLDELFTDTWSKDQVQNGRMAHCAEICGTNNAMDKLYVK